MYMHLLFFDGSNPWLSFHKTADAIKRDYKRFSRGHAVPLEMRARIDVFSSAVDGLRIYTNSGGGFSVAWRDDNNAEHFLPRVYTRFSAAVDAMGRMSAKLQNSKPPV